MNWARLGGRAAKERFINEYFWKEVEKSEAYLAKKNSTRPQNKRIPLWKDVKASMKLGSTIVPTMPIAPTFPEEEHIPHKENSKINMDYLRFCEKYPLYGFKETGKVKGNVQAFYQSLIFFIGHLRNGFLLEDLDFHLDQFVYYYPIRIQGVQVTQCGDQDCPSDGTRFSGERNL